MNYLNRMREAFAIYALTQDTQVRTESANREYMTEGR